MAIVDIDLIPIGSAQVRLLTLLPSSDVNFVGNWVQAYAQVTITNEKITKKRNNNAYRYAVISSKNKIDLTKYAKIVFKGVASNCDGSDGMNYRSYYGVNPTMAEGEESQNSWTRYVNTTTNETFELSLNISDLSGEYYICMTGGAVNFEVSEIYLEPYPTKLESNELYAYGLGINKWDNSGYLVNQNYSQKGGFNIQPHYLYSNNTTNSKSNCIVTNEMIDLSKWKTLNIIVNNKSYSFDISSRTDMQYIVISQAYANGTPYNRVYLAPTKNNYGHTSFTIDSSASMSVTKVWLE